MLHCNKCLILTPLITISGFPSTYSVNTASTCSYTGRGILTNKDPTSSFPSVSDNQSGHIFYSISQPRRSLHSTMCTDQKELDFIHPRSKICFWVKTVVYDLVFLNTFLGISSLKDDPFYCVSQGQNCHKLYSKGLYKN